jgi:hypothetical protein
MGRDSRPPMTVHVVQRSARAGIINRYQVRVHATQAAASSRTADLTTAATVDGDHRAPPPVWAQHLCSSHQQLRPLVQPLARA